MLGCVAAVITPWVCPGGTGVKSAGLPTAFVAQFESAAGAPYLRPSREERRLTGFDLSTPRGRLHARLRYLWDDHAWLRLKTRNAHWITPEFIRAPQPWPFQLKHWRDRGVKTVLSLRGDLHKAHRALEAEACARLGLTLVDLDLRSREAPTLKQVLEAKRIFESIEYPCLAHCKAGADRAGMAAVLYLHFRQGVPIAEARRQLSLRYGHFRQGRTGVLDHVLERYLADTAATGETFLEWVGRPGYDAAAIKAGFKPTWLGGLITDVLLGRE